MFYGKVRDDGHSQSGVPVNPPTVVEQRQLARLRTINRVARVRISGEQILARVFNISDGGIMLSAPPKPSLGDTVKIDLSETCTVTGKIIWYNSEKCGVKFDAEIDTAAVMKRLHNERHTDQWRPLRVRRNTGVVVSSTLGTQTARLHDLSQAGLKLRHTGLFMAGLRVKVLFPQGVECRGVVRWSEDGLAGVQLLDPLSVEQTSAIC